jgi:calcineurin-like phosphoesterase family protein
MPKQFFIADTHFGHENIIEYENRPFRSITEMDDTLIKNWNKTVGKKDTIFILGDFAFATKERIKELVHLLHGSKIIILGNHDKTFTYSWWKTAGFYMVCKYPIIIDQWFILSHEPLYTNTNMPYINIFGHVHSNPQYLNYSKQHFCVSCERIVYTPIEMNEMQSKIKDIGY